MVHKFVDSSGKPARDFASIEEMDETMIDRWNMVVKPSDHVYHLGDVAMKVSEMDRVMPRLKGHKRLVRGNHDIFPTEKYLKYFDEIHGVRVFEGLLLSHIPIAPWSFGRWTKANVHGHVHLSEPLIYDVPTSRGETGFSKMARYINLSVERTDYSPVSLETVRKWSEAR